MFIEDATSWFEVVLFNCDVRTLREPFDEAMRLYNIIIDSVLFLNSNIGDMTSPYDIHTFTILADLKFVRHSLSWINPFACQILSATEEGTACT